MNAERRVLPMVTEFTRYGPEGARLTIERIGSTPAAFFVSGIHGDEREIVQPLRHLLNEKAHSEPEVFGSQVRVLEAHPAAVEQGTRKVNEVDLNRQFVFKPLPDHPQARLLADALLEHREVHTLFSFHEDPLENRFYFYNLMTRDDDGSKNTYIDSLRDRLMTAVKSLDISLYNGVDDIDLGYWVDRGFCAVASDAMHDNSFEMWAVQKELHQHPAMEHAFLFEIPGKLSLPRKEALIKTILDEFVGPYMAHQEKRL